MLELKYSRRRILPLVICLYFGSTFATPAHSAGTGGYSSSIGGSARALPGSSVIRHGSSGFSIYNGEGVTRVIGGPPSRGNVTLPDGRKARLVGDGRGGAWLLGAPGNHWIPGPGTGRVHEPRRLHGDGP